jgi:hypothetical protein
MSRGLQVGLDGRPLLHLIAQRNEWLLNRLISYYIYVLIRDVRTLHFIHKRLLQMPIFFMEFYFYI